MNVLEGWHGSFFASILMLMVSPVGVHAGEKSEDLAEKSQSVSITQNKANENLKRIKPNQKATITQKSIIDHYDQEASKYDDAYSAPLCKAEDKTIIKLIEPLLGRKVLDVGCGTGLLLDHLKLENYLGFDISPKMISIAKAKHPNKNLIVGDMEEIIPKTDSASFDSIVCLYGPISYSLQPENLIKEFYRVLKPGGSLVVMPYTKRIEQNFFLGKYSTAVEASVLKTFYTSKMLENIVNGSGFVDTEILGINYFGNFIEVLDKAYGNNHSEEFYTRLLLEERKTAHSLPIEYARHGLLIAKKPLH